RVTAARLGLERVQHLSQQHRLVYEFVHCSFALLNQGSPAPKNLVVSRFHAAPTGSSRSTTAATGLATWPRVASRIGTTSKSASLKSLRTTFTFSKDNSPWTDGCALCAARAFAGRFARSGSGFSLSL